VSLDGAVVCPHPPMMIPELGRALPLDVRDLAVAAVARLLARRPDLLVVVGDGPATGTYPAGTPGGFRGFGADVEVQLGPVTRPQAQPQAQPPNQPPAQAPPSAPAHSTPAEPSLPPAVRGPAGAPARLPLSLAVGAWLLARAGSGGGDADVPVLGVGVRADSTPEAAAALGAALAARAPRVGLLVMGDGSARRDEKAPGYRDERAPGFDAAAAAALAAGDPDSLLALDAGLARDLLAAGRASWQVLAGARISHPISETGSTTERDTGVAWWSSTLSYDAAPYGVGYLVATWERRGPLHGYGTSGGAASPGDRADRGRRPGGAAGWSA